MKKFWNVSRKYLFCLLLVLGIFTVIPYLCFRAMDGGRTMGGVVVVFFIYPLCALLYGVLSYALLKKVWIPQLILYIITCASLFGLNLIADKELEPWLGILIVAFALVLFSLIGTLLAFLGRLMIKGIKKICQRVKQRNRHVN